MNNKIENLKTNKQIYCDICKPIVKNRNRDKLIQYSKDYYRTHKDDWRKYALEKGYAQGKQYREDIKNLKTINSKVVIKICKICNKQFGVLKRNLDNNNIKGIYCSQECKRQDGKVLTTCKYCKKEFHSTFHKINTTKDKYCSWECRKKDNSAIKYCCNCGKEFIVKKSRVNTNHYCRHSCHMEHLKKLRTKNCGYCGKEFTPPATKGYKIYCSKECQSNWLADRNREWLEKGVYKKSKNKFETAICEQILKSGYKLDEDFYWQKHIILEGNHFVIDFVFPKLNLYLNAQGDYWHYNKNNIKIIRRVPNKNQLEHIKRDEKLRELISNTTITLKEVWETDFYKDKKVIDRILADVIAERTTGRDYLLNTLNFHKERRNTMTQKENEDFFTDVKDEQNELPDYAKAEIIDDRMRESTCGLQA